MIKEKSRKISQVQFTLKQEATFVCLMYVVNANQYYWSESSQNSVLSVTTWYRNKLPPAHQYGTALCSPYQDVSLSRTVFLNRSPPLSHDGTTELHAVGTPIFIMNRTMMQTDLLVQVSLIDQRKWHDAYLQVVHMRQPLGVTLASLPPCPSLVILQKMNRIQWNSVRKTQTTKRKRRKGWRRAAIKSPIWILQYQVYCATGSIIMFSCNFITRCAQKKEWKSCSEEENMRGKEILFK